MRGKKILWSTLIALLLSVSLVNIGMAQEPSTALISVDPPEITNLLPGDSFAVDIFITGADNVYTWGIELSYAPRSEILSITDVIEGDFLERGGETYISDFWIEPFYGILRFGVTLKAPDEVGVSGDGILATVVFIILEAGESDLHLVPGPGNPEVAPEGDFTALLDFDKNYLPYNLEDGYYLGPMADLVAPTDIVTERPTGGGQAQAEWKKTMRKRWGTVYEMPTSVTNTGYAPLWTRIKYTSTNEHTGEVVTLYSGQEYFPLASYRTEVLYVNEEAAVLWDMWTKYGTSPYLDATGDGSYLEAYDDGMLSNAYGFEDVSLGPYDKIIDVVLEGYTQYPGGPDSDMDMDTYVWTPSDYRFAWLGSLYGDASWGWHSPRWIGDHVSDAVPATTTEAGLNDLAVLFYYWTADGLPHGDMRIDSARLIVTIETGGVYQIDPMWTQVDPGVTVELPPVLWHLEQINTGKWYTTITMDYRYYDPYTIPSVLQQQGETTFTYEWWIKGEGIED